MFLNACIQLKIQYYFIFLVIYYLHIFGKLQLKQHKFNQLET